MKGDERRLKNKTITKKNRIKNSFFYGTMKNYIFERRAKMKKNIKDLLDEEIIAQIESLKTLDDGSKEKQSAIDDLNKLYRLKIDETRMGLEFEEKKERREMENTLQSDELIIKEKQLDAENDARSCEEQFKAEQLKEQVKDRYFKVGIAAAEIIIPIVFYGVWLKRGFKFEETGIFTSTTFRSLFNRFKPTKK